MVIRSPMERRDSVRSINLLSSFAELKGSDSYPVKINVTNIRFEVCSKSHVIFQSYFSILKNSFASKTGNLLFLKSPLFLVIIKSILFFSDAIY